MTDRANGAPYIVGGIIFFTVFCVYLRTMPPVSGFWDCGEYLAATASLGIPHQPGTPLLIMAGRVWQTVFGFIADPGQRYNLFAIAGGALVAFFVYLAALKAFALASCPLTTSLQRTAVFGGAAAAALFCAFGKTFWTCSLDMSEQSNVPLLPLVIQVWLALSWASSASPRRDRLLLLIAYVSFAGAGLHMISLIALPALFLFVMMIDAGKRRSWAVWVTGASLLTVMYHLSWFLIASGVVLAAAGLMALLSHKKRRVWSFCFFLAFFSLLGFSNHLYLPVRASLGPAIDQGHPVTWRSFSSFIDRDQYIPESMVSRAFWRRGDPANQFGIHERIGYGGFHLTQFFRFRPGDASKNFLLPLTAGGVAGLMVYLLPTLLALYGWWRLSAKKPAVAVLVAGATLITTLALAWYMNFADGTRPEYHDWKAWTEAGKPGPEPLIHAEVRRRDYFFNAGFMFFALSIGLGGGFLALALLSSRRHAVRKTIAPAFTVLLCASPALPLWQNYGDCDRHAHTLPYDYACNMLASCEPNGILFASGDNTTYPLWAVQEGYGLRRDVRVVNLSLLNTPWYLKQLRDREPRVPIPYSDNDMATQRAQINTLASRSPARLPHAGITVELPAANEARMFRIQDMAILNIVDANAWKKPVYFATNVGNADCFPFLPFFRQQGLVRRIMPLSIPVDRSVDEKTSADLLEHRYVFRNLDGPGTVRDEAENMVLTNYGAAFTAAAWGLLRAAEKLPDTGVGRVTLVNRAGSLIDRACTLLPDDRQLREFRRAAFKAN